MWKKCDEFTSLYQNILKLLFCRHVRLLRRKTTLLQIPPHMGKRYAIWRRSRIGSALVRVRQPICSELSAMATYLFHRSGLKHYSTIPLLTLRVKFDGISPRKRSWSTCRDQRLFAVFATLFPLKEPFARKMFLFWSLHFCLLSSTKPVPMYLVTCWKYNQSHIFISPCRNDPPQLQNCRTMRFLTVFGTLLVTCRQSKEILSPTHPHIHTPTHPHTPKRSMFCLVFANLNVSFGLIREAQHGFNVCAKIWFAPGT